MKLNDKGFTLIELLAVIVVLAVIMLVAVTAVVPMMERARKQSFVTEAETILKGAENYFAYKDMTNGEVSKVNVNPWIMDCVNVNTNNSIEEDLIGEYVEEKGKSEYKGVVLKYNDPGEYTETGMMLESPFESRIIILINDEYYLRAVQQSEHYISFASFFNIPSLDSLNDKYVFNKKEFKEFFSPSSESSENSELIWDEFSLILSSCSNVNEAIASDINNLGMLLLSENIREEILNDVS